MRRLFTLMLIGLCGGCALDDPYHDHCSVAPVAAYQTSPPPLASSSCGVVPAAYTPQTKEPPR